MQHLGDVIRRLLRLRNMTASALAGRVGISSVAMSRIVRGRARPRQATFTRLYKELVTTPEEGQWMVRFFSDVGGQLAEADILQSLENDKVEAERVERFMEVRSQSMAFRAAVAKELQRLGLTFQQDYYEGATSTDFLVEHKGQRIALECKFNTGRDFPKTILMAKLILARLPCDKVLIVVPFEDRTIEAELPKQESRLILLTLSSLPRIMDC